MVQLRAERIGTVRRGRRCVGAMPSVASARPPTDSPPSCECDWAEASQGLSTSPSKGSPASLLPGLVLLYSNPRNAGFSARGQHYSPKRRRSNPLLITSHSHNRTTMQFEVEVNVMPQRALLDPQGRAVKNTLQQAGYQGVVDVRMGKHIVLSLEANSEDEARQRVNTLCAKVLSNPVMEGFEYSIKTL